MDLNPMQYICIYIWTGHVVIGINKKLKRVAFGWLLGGGTTQLQIGEPTYSGLANLKLILKGGRTTAMTKRVVRPSQTNRLGHSKVFSLIILLH
jgi:hypothetical protein